METFRDRVAVITGAASGIGRGLARRCAREGMAVVLADIDAPALAETGAELRALGAPVLSVVTDVANLHDVERLAAQTMQTFGAVHLLCNNAGVGVIRSAWESTLADWTWVLGVNLWGVIHGIRVFVPLLLQQPAESHIVNTASIAGLVVAPGSASAYAVSKHGVVALSETLYYDLAQRAPHVRVSVLCPGWVQTHIDEAERHRPIALRNDPGLPPNPAEVAAQQEVRHALQAGVSPDAVAAIVFEAIQQERLYIFTDAVSQAWVVQHLEYRRSGRNPPRDPA